jgi:predicted Zn-dependent protease
MHARMVWLCMVASAACGTAGASTALPWPAPPSALPTTSGEVYLGNLDGRIESLERVLASAPTPALRVALAGALYHRYRIVANLADAEAALDQLDRAVVQSPRDRQALQLRATVRAGFHRFAEASADLDAAEAAGATPASLADARREIALATGRYAALAAELARSDSPEGGLYELAFRGNLRLLQGDLAGAGRQFERAQAQATDSSPVPLAWLHLQQGIALLRAGNPAAANRWFRSAHERLPGYTLATEHLAETEVLLGRLDAARPLYQDVIARTGSPEFLHALASLEARAGRTREAVALQARADASWAALVSRQPAAFAQHAIAFYLDRDRPDEALRLARGNTALRQDVLSWILLARAAEAAGDATTACEASAKARGTGMRPPEIEALEAVERGCTTRVAQEPPVRADAVDSRPAALR